MGDIVMDIKNPKIEGDCSISGHEKKIMCESISWGSSASIATTGHGSGQTFGGSSVHEMLLTKHVDTSSPKLFNHCAQGIEISNIEIMILASGKQINQPILTYKLEGVLVTSLQTSGGGSGHMMESVSFAVRKVDLTYRQLDDNGNFVDNFPATYDMRTMQTT
jgi:type VI secretion system secreted protein Hcp